MHEQGPIRDGVPAGRNGRCRASELRDVLAVQTCATSCATSVDSPARRTLGLGASAGDRGARNGSAGRVLASSRSVTGAGRRDCAGCRVGTMYAG